MSEKRSEYQKAYQAAYRQKVKRIGLVLSKDEYRLFQRAAGKKRVPTLVKELALAGLQQQAVIPDALEKELSTLRFAIRNVANNVNQMAHYSHTVRSMTAENENNLLQHLKQLEEAVQAYTEGRILGEPPSANGGSDDH